MTPCGLQVLADNSDAPFQHLGSSDVALKREATGKQEAAEAVQHPFQDVIDGLLRDPLQALSSWYPCRPSPLPCSDAPLACWDNCPPQFCSL